MGLAKRIEEALAAARQASEDFDTDQETRRRQAVLGVAFVALRPDWTAENLGDAIRQTSVPRRTNRKLLLTSSKDVRCFQIDSVTTEHLPVGTGRSDEFLYACRKLSSVLTRWNVLQLHALDPEARAFLNSAFEQKLVTDNDVKLV